MPAELLVESPRRALAVYAHPDDPYVACGATLARWAAAGSEVHVLLVSLGDKGTSEASTEAGELVERRRGEVEAAGEVIGVSSLVQLGRLDGEIDNDLELRAELVRHIRRLRPQVLVCPDPSAVFFGEHYYNHRDHRVVGFAALDAASPAAASPLYFPDAGDAWQVETAYLSGTLEPNVFVDVSATIADKARSVLCHLSQLGGGGARFQAVLEARAADAGRLAGVGHAESFRRIRLGGT